VTDVEDDNNATPCDRPVCREGLEAVWKIGRGGQSATHRKTDGKAKRGPKRTVDELGSASVDTLSLTSGLDLRRNDGSAQKKRKEGGREGRRTLNRRNAVQMVAQQMKAAMEVKFESHPRTVEAPSERDI
jgi:hypothetical protein